MRRETDAGGEEKFHQCHPTELDNDQSSQTQALRALFES